MADERPGFLVYHETMDGLSEYTDSEIGKFVRAMAEFARYGVIPDFTDRGLRSLWKLVQPKMEHDEAVYRKRCLENRYNAYVSAEKRKFRRECPDKGEPIEGIDYQDRETWLAQQEQATAQRLQTNASDRSAIVSDLKPTQQEPNRAITQQSKKESREGSGERVQSEQPSDDIQSMFSEWIEAINSKDFTGREKRNMSEAPVLRESGSESL